jgi:hypothetical protein
MRIHGNVQIMKYIHPYYLNLIPMSHKTFLHSSENCLYFEN